MSKFKVIGSFSESMDTAICLPCPCRMSKPGTRRVEGEKKNPNLKRCVLRVSLCTQDQFPLYLSSSSSSSSSVGELISFPLLPYLGICTAARCFKNIFWRKSPYIDFATILLPQNIKLFSYWLLLLTR